MGDEIAYPFLNSNGATVEVWECISNFIKHFIIGVITDRLLDLSKTVLAKGPLVLEPKWFGRLGSIFLVKSSAAMV